MAISNFPNERSVGRSVVIDLIYSSSLRWERT